MIVFLFEKIQFTLSQYTLRTFNNCASNQDTSIKPSDKIPFPINQAAAKSDKMDGLLAI